MLHALLTACNLHFLLLSLTLELTYYTFQTGSSSKSKGSPPVSFLTPFPLNCPSVPFAWPKEGILPARRRAARDGHSTVPMFLASECLVHFPLVSTLARAYPQGWAVWLPALALGDVLRPPARASVTREDMCVQKSRPDGLMSLNTSVPAFGAWDMAVLLSASYGGGCK